MGKTADSEGTRRISVDLPNQLIDRFDQLKREWGLRARGDVLKRLLEELLYDDVDRPEVDNTTNIVPQDYLHDDKDQVPHTPQYIENKALVLIGSKNSDSSNSEMLENQVKAENNKGIGYSNSGGIDLPGFVRKRTKNLKHSLNKQKTKSENDDFDSLIKPVSESDVSIGLKGVTNHWMTLYGQTPNERVIEAAMTWLARDIWPHIEGTENVSFTWSEANRVMQKYCPEWKNKTPTFERVIVLAGVLEDPFSASNLNTRIPTLIRRFVNRFKRSQNVTSFQTLESTMTVHGALKLLDLSTTEGASHTLSKIRDAYKSKALNVHPDAGGSTEAMRKVNEAYQLLRELYRK